MNRQIGAFTNELAKRGFVWQFITLAGFHCNGLGVHNFAKAYAERGMAAYNEMIQREERRTGVPLLKHQVRSRVRVRVRFRVRVRGEVTLSLT